MAGKWIEITAADGGKFRGYLTVPAKRQGARHRAVPGDLRHQRLCARGRRLLRRGRLRRAGARPVLAHGAGRRSRLHAKRTWKKAFDFFQRFDVDKGMDDITAAVKALRARPEVAGKVGALGFCLGGKLAYLAAARSGVDVAVGYYGVGIEAALERAAQVSRPCCTSPRRTSSFRPKRWRRSRPRSRTAATSRSTSTPDRTTPSRAPAATTIDKPSALMAHHRSIAAVPARDGAALRFLRAVGYATACTSSARATWTPP